jgi:hypothetical protein
MSKTTKNMKATIISFVMLAAIMSAQSQDMKTILGTGKSKVIGAYGAASQKFSAIDGQFASLLGGYGGVLFNHNFLLGAGAYALLNGRQINIENDPNTSRQLTCIGLIGERTFNPEKVVHFSANLFTGAAIIGEQSQIDGGGQYTISSRGAFLIEPGIEGEINLTRWFRIAAGASYRFAAGESKFSAPAANISLKFGKF